MRQYEYLFALGEIDVATQSELSQLLSIDRSTNALVIGILEKKGLIERSVNGGAKSGHGAEQKSASLGVTGVLANALPT